MRATSTHPDSRMMSLDAIGFHETTLAGIDAEGLPGTLRLLIDDAMLDGEARRIEVVFEDIGRIQRDSLPLRKPVMEMPDAEILTLAPGAAGCWDLIVKWNNFARRQSRTVAYEIETAAATAFLLPRSATEG